MGRRRRGVRWVRSGICGGLILGAKWMLEGALIVAPVSLVEIALTARHRALTPRESLRPRPRRVDEYRRVRADRLSW